MLSSIQEFLGKRSILSALKQCREKKILNFHTAKTMGIVFMATDEWDMKILENFIQTVEKNNIQVKVIGWVNEKEIPSKFKENQTITFLSKKDLNFWGLPYSENFRNFVTQKHDILVDFSFIPNTITSVISAKTNAKMKVSKDMEETRNIFDFLIKIDNNAKQSTFTEQVTYYLNTINSSK